MKRFLKFLPVVFALVILLSFGAFATESEIVLPEAPTTVEGTNSGAGLKGIMWDEVEGADGYDVYLKVNGEWVYQSSTIGCSEYVYNLISNSEYEVGVKSYIIVDGVKYYSEKMCTGIIYSSTAVSPVTLKAKSVKGGIKLTWETKKGISGYRLYVVKDGKWTKIKDIYGADKNEFLYADVKVGTEYKFGIKTFAKGNLGLKFSNLSTRGITHKDVMKVTVTASGKTASTVTLKWNKAEDAWGYRVYVYQSSKWKALKTTTALSYQVTGLEASKKYIFRVKAYSRINGEVIWHAASENCSVITSSKTVDAYRIKNLQKSFSDGDWYVKLKNMTDANGKKLTYTIAGKGENLFCRYDYGNGMVIEYFYNASNGRLYIISDADKEYVLVPKSEAEDYIELMYANAEVLKVQNVGKVTAKTTVYNSYSAVQETYTDTKYGFKKTYYFVKDKVAGLTVVYEGAKDKFSSYSVTDTPSSSLFKVPATYKKVSWQ